MLSARDQRAYAVNMTLLLKLTLIERDVRQGSPLLSYSFLPPFHIELFGRKSQVTLKEWGLCSTY